MESRLFIGRPSLGTFGPWRTTSGRAQSTVREIRQTARGQTGRRVRQPKAAALPGATSPASTRRPRV